LGWSARIISRHQDGVELIVRIIDSRPPHRRLGVGYSGSVVGYTYRIDGTQAGSATTSVGAVAANGAISKIGFDALAYS